MTSMTKKVLIFGSLTSSIFMPKVALSNLIEVTTFEDELNNDGDCSLREAVEAANTDLPVDACTAGLESDQIQLPVGVFNLTRTGADEGANQTGDLDIQENLIITGEGADRTMIDATGLGDRIFELVNLGVEVEISGMTLTGGNPAAGLDNDGGAISLTGGSLQMNNVQITGNQAENGGAIFASLTEVTLRNSTLSDNSAGERGGAINADGSGINLINTTISGNNAANGGGLAGDNTQYNFRSSTIVSNTASGIGGGLFGDGSVTGSVENTILAGNTATTSGMDCGEAVGGNISLGNFGFNIFGDVNVCTETSTDDQVLLNPDDLKLGILENNGGMTLTHALLPGSPAIDRANPAGCDDTSGTPLTTDQIGQSRVIDGNQDGTSRCDVGAFEFQIEEAGGGGCSLIPLKK